jgi:UDP-glucose 4-epimerase
MKILVNKNILITGGTGSFGNALTKKIIRDKIKINKLVVFSRDEKKQFDMRNLFKDSNLKIDFIIGDVRDESALDFATRNIDFIFHAAALKHLTLLEKFPDEAYKTNVLATKNLIETCLKNNVTYFINISTDKAAEPISQLGKSKHICERIISAVNETDKKYISVRFGNVVGSNG